MSILEVNAIDFVREAGQQGVKSTDCNAAAAVSIAISLKRIADALNPENGQDVGSTLFYIEQRLGPQS